MTRRPRRNHTASFKAKVALAALKGDKTLAASTTSVTAGSSVTLTATVAAGTTPVPSGLVTFASGTTSLGVAQLSASQATLVTTSLPVGMNVLWLDNVLSSRAQRSREICGGLFQRKDKPQVSPLRPLARTPVEMTGFFGWA